MKMDPSAARVFRALLVLLTLSHAAAASSPCPRPCACPQPTEVHCTFRSLFTIPAALPKHVKRMNLGFNSINKITDKSLAGLRKLELLLVHGNDIHSLPDGAFRDLSSLQMLKISYNKLKEINRHTLRGLWALARLHLDHNHLEFIHPDSFQGLTSLRLLQLEGNRLQQLHPATFATFTLLGCFHVSTLKHLYLSDNELETLPAKLVATMPQLENLYLHGNPWTCDCNMRWIQDWDKKAPGVLKCKKDKALPGGQSCPMCSSPRHVQKEELKTVKNFACSSPVISFPGRTSSPDDAESELMTVKDFSDPFGNISLGLSDEHGNEVDLECSLSKPRDFNSINWEQLDELVLASNMSLSVDIECLVDREKYERLWRLIAYYSSVPAHLQRGIMLGKEPHPTYVYKQDSEKDAQYYTGVKVNIMAQPAWLMQASADLQLNRLQSSAKTVNLILSTDLSEMVELELVRRQRRTWVMIESTNKTRKVLSAVLGRPSQMDCNIHSSGQALIRWMLPDGSKVEAPYSSPDNRVSVSSEGQLVIKAVKHTDAGIYYCTAKVQGDLAVLPFHLSVQESSSSPPGEDASTTPIEAFAGSPISLPCVTSGSPDAEINWILPNSNIVRFQANSSRAFVFSNGTLHIPQTQSSDSGHYKCIAINQHGVDAAVTKITLMRRKGLVRPLRKFPARPQSASGINTQITVPIEDAEETSGDSEVPRVLAPKRPLEPIRRRIPGGVAPGRRGIHPSRNMWRRPQVHRKPTGSQVEDRRTIIESRRKINASKSKIDPEKWADILAKIRDRKAQTTVTPLPVQSTTEKEESEPTTRSDETAEGSSDGVTALEKAGQEYYTTRPIPAQETQMNPNKQDAQGRGTYVTGSYSAYETEAVTSTAHHTHSTHGTGEPHSMQTEYHVQHITPDPNLDVHTTSNSVFFLPQTTSVSPNAVTFWQANTNTDSSSFSLEESHGENAAANGVGTADWLKATETSRNMDSNDSSNESQITLSANTNELETNQEENGKYISETASASQTQPKATTQDDLQSQTILTTASPTVTAVLTVTRGGSRPRLRMANSRKKNGGRRKRPNRRKQKVNKPTQFTAATPAYSPSATERTTTSSQLKIEPSEVTTASFSTTVPFSSSQAASSDPLSHEESRVLGPDAKATTKLSLEASPRETNDSVPPLAKPPFESTSAAPSFPTVSPGVGHRRLSSPAVLEISETLSPSVSFDMHTSISSKGITVGPPTPELLGETEEITEEYETLQYAESSSGAFHAVTQEPQNVQLNQSDHDTSTQIEEKRLAEENDSHFSPLPSSSTSGLSLEDELMTTPGYTSKGLITTPSSLYEVDFGTTEYATKETSAPEILDHSSGQNQISYSESEGERVLETDTTSIREHPSTTPLIPEVLIPTTVVPYVTLPSTTPTGPSMGQSLGATTPSDIYRQDQQTSAPERTSDFYHSTQSADDNLDPFIDANPTSPAVKLNSRQTVKQVATPVPTVAAPQTDSLGQAVLTSTSNMYEKHQLPGQGSTPRGKPSITKSNFQTYTVRAEADVQLPCKAEGEPMPFLSWTKVASGASIAQNTIVQRFEVDSNGTLIIKNAQPMDGGQYLCTVQNQYGTDKMVVNLVIQSQHPRVLHPQQRDFSVDLGAKINLDCVVEGHPTPRVTWVLPNHAHMTASPLGASPQQRVSILTNGTLRINEATYTDKGIYKCIGSSSAGADTVLVRLHVSTLPPSIQQNQNENTTLLEGSAAYIDCTASGTPRPVTRWITPDGAQHIPSQFASGHSLFVFPNGTLYIRGLSPRNAGRYECLASNTVATSRRIVFVSIRRNPSTTKAKITLSSPQRTDVTYGGRLLLNCVAKGEPEPWILWRTPSKKLVDAQYSFDSRIKVFPNGTITIHSMTDKDSGDYLCVARNKMGDDYVLLGVNVLTRPAKIKHKQQQSSQEVVYGGDLKVDCVASGLPNPEISWALPDGTMVNPEKLRDGFSGGRRRRYVVFDNGTLYFNDVGMPEEGDYTCYAENELGKDEMRVRVKVKVATSPPLIQDKNQKILRVRHGDTVTLRCTARGEMVPVITWISPTNRVITPASEKYQVLDDGTLVVQNVHSVDGGNYTCLAKNNAGQDQKVIRLEVLVTSPAINGLSGTVNLMKATAIQDQQKFIDCVAKGTPNPRVMWVLPGNVILTPPYYSNRMVVHQNGTLEIRSPRKTDSGQLACIARNEGGEVRLVVNLEVKDAVERPQVRGPKLESLSLTVGNAMTLNCSFEGSTLPHVTWILPDGSPLRSGAKFSKFYHRPDGSLIITNPSVAEAGAYRCVGRIPQGIVERTVTLSPGRKPEINNRYHAPVSVMIGERLLLHCATSGEPLRLTWTLPTGVVLNRPQRAGRYTVLANGTLSIQQVSIYDRGSYVCRVANEYGSSLLPVSVSVVAYPPQITSGPPSVTYAKRGVAIQLNCIATGIPRADVAWETPDKARLVVSAQPRLFGNKYLHPQGSLIIQNPTQRDAGVYRCTARNAIGLDSKATFLNVF